MTRLAGVYLGVPANRLRDALAAAMEFAERYPDREFYDLARVGDFDAEWALHDGEWWTVAVRLAPEDGE